MTRFAVISDLHGKYEHLQDIVEAGKGRIDAIVMTGDYLEAKISKKHLHLGLEWPLEDVVDVDPELWSFLESCTLVRGNQEERIAAVMAGRPVPALLAPLLAAPGEWATRTTRFVHGHGFPWARTGGQLDHPLLDDTVSADRAVIVHGHSHRRLLTLGSGVRIEPVTGQPYALAPEGTCVVNVGAARDPEAHWVLYDEDARTITFETARTTGVR
ncbi:metallophosphoesterase [Streptomyces virginiae]|uniref:Metallophosphatase family protein n=1 Tax=Streptomyces virginiae TaxID=1961 RepID=A0ABZ1TJR0_STRVG|nr:metallophosphoesterase [Streptomyces virginiae]WTB26107.1 metallophosphatase family protein [Streptomyces virginiae]